MKTRQNGKGFSLIEILIVLVIISGLIWASIGYMQQRSQQMRIEKMSAQMQQILNAALSYYVVNGTWPTSINCLRGVSPCSVIYLPPTVPMVSLFGGTDYDVYSTSSLFYLSTMISSVAPGASTSPTQGNIARAIAGTLPLGYVTGGTLVPATPCVTGNCRVVAVINVPGQNTNNARNVAFAGLYHHGGCVPVPTCPVDANGTTMTPQVMIAPVSVSGINDTDSDNVYPISSFTGYATGPATNPPACGTLGAQVACSPIQASTTYWRACMQVVTEKGDVATTNAGAGVNTWGAKVTLLALTRCAVTNEPAGSPFTVYSR